MSDGARARLAQLSPKLAHFGLSRNAATVVGARLATARRLGSEGASMLVTLHQPLLELAASFAFIGPRGSAALLVAHLGLFGVDALGRHRRSALAQIAGSRRSWSAFSEAAFAGGGALAHRWAKSRDTALLAYVTLGGSTRFDPIELASALHAKWRKAWVAGDEPEFDHTARAVAAIRRAARANADATAPGRS